jgi:hypothetical protein
LPATHGPGGAAAAENGHLVLHGGRPLEGRAFEAPPVGKSAPGADLSGWLCSSLPKTVRRSCAESAASAKAAPARTPPARGTWTIDLTGSFLLGVLIGCAEPVHLHPLLIAAVGTGFLGA